jgi:hypothetical protein
MQCTKINNTLKFADIYRGRTLSGFSYLTNLNFVDFSAFVISWHFFWFLLFGVRSFLLTKNR